MADVLTKSQRSYNMSRIRSRETKVEITLKKALKGLRLRYQPKTEGKPDFSSKKHKIAIFVDGCFWHKCPKCFVEPQTNKDFWKKKMEKNVKRDYEITKKMESDGWKVLRFWEHDIKSNLQNCVSYVKDKISNPELNNVVDIFAGPGGLSLGFELVKDGKGKNVYNVLAAVEMDPCACKTLKRNSSANVIEGDIINLEVKRKIESFCAGRTDILVGGPPCQSFSMIGPRSGNPDGKKDADRYDGLYEHFLDMVLRLQPKIVLFENVKGLLSKKNGDEKVIDKILSGLHSFGYDTRTDEGKDYMILNSADYGVPQTRERVFIIANKIGMKNTVPKKTHSKPVKSKSNKYSVKTIDWVTLKDAIGDLPPVKARKTMTDISEKKMLIVEKYNKNVDSGNDEKIYIKEMGEKHLILLEESGKEFFSFVRSGDKLTHHTARPQMKTDIALFRGMLPGETAKDLVDGDSNRKRKLAKLIKYDMSNFTDKYKKHEWNKPCSTIFAHMKKDGNRFIHPDSKQARTFTPREAARIQSFPDWFYFEGPMSKKFQQIGNAVPPLLARSIACSILNGLNGFKKLENEANADG